MEVASAAPQKKILRPLGGLALLLLPLLRRVAGPPDSYRRKLLERRVQYTADLKAHRRDLVILKKQLQKEAINYARIAVAVWTRRGENWIDRGGKTADPDNKRPDDKKRRRRKVKKVRFERLVCSPDAIYAKIKTGKKTLFGGYKSALPYRVDVADLVDDKALLEISLACQHRVTAQYDDPSRGAWIIFWRTEGVGGLPRLITFRQVLEHFDQNDPAPLVLGAFNNRDVYVKSLTSSFHLLIGGSAGSGKSNILNCIIAGLIRHVPASDLKLILIDRKQMEFSYYADIPHLLQPSIFDVDQTIEALRWLEKELKRRTGIMAGRAKELAAFNTRFPAEKMPRIVCIIDEFADFSLMEDKRKASTVIDLVTQLVNLGRAPGIHVILCTQRPDSHVMPGRVRTNFQLTIAGRVPNTVQSVVILGMGDAAWLPDVPGRMLALCGSHLDAIQTPFITEDDIDEACKIARGRAAGVIHLAGIDPEVDRDGLAKFIVDDPGLAGSLALESVAGVVGRLGVSRAMVKGFIKELRGVKSLTIDDEQYNIVDDRSSWRIVRVLPSEVVATPDWVDLLAESAESGAADQVAEIAGPCDQVIDDQVIGPVRSIDRIVAVASPEWRRELTVIRARKKEKL